METLNETALSLLQKTALFQNLNPVQLQKLLKDRGRTIEFSAGDILYDPHHFQRAIGIVLKGLLKVSTENEVVLNQLSVGAMFGVAGLFLERDEYVTVIRAIKPSQVFFLTADDLEYLFKEDYTVCQNYLRFLSQRIVFLNQRISSFVAPNPAEALYAFLTRLAIAAESETFHLPMSKQEICRQLNISRTTLYRAWDQLLQEGRLLEHSDTSLQVLPNIIF
jgi:CRP-like cAMP-binding protein